MALANVTLKQGKTYRTLGYTFTAGKAVQVSDPGHIRTLQTNGLLNVELLQDAPVPNKTPMKARPAPLPEPEDDGLPDDEGDQGGDGADPDGIATSPGGKKPVVPGKTPMKAPVTKPGILAPKKA